MILFLLGLGAGLAINVVLAVVRSAAIKGARDRLEFLQEHRAALQPYYEHFFFWVDEHDAAIESGGGAVAEEAYARLKSADRDLQAKREELSKDPRCPEDMRQNTT